jgi:hypothetical protein
MGAAIHGPDGHTELGNEPLTIGRSRNNRLVYTNSQISSRHAEIQPLPGGRYQVVDVGSTNGTAVNGVKLNAGVPQPLNAGDVVVLGGSGGVELRFELTATDAPWVPNQPQMPPPGPTPFSGQGAFGPPVGASFGGISQPAPGGPGFAPAPADPGALGQPFPAAPAQPGFPSAPGSFDAPGQPGPQPLPPAPGAFPPNQFGPPPAGPGAPGPFGAPGQPGPQPLPPGQAPFAPTPGGFPPPNQFGPPPAGPGAFPPAGPGGPMGGPPQPGMPGAFPPQPGFQGQPMGAPGFPPGMGAPPAKKGGSRRLIWLVVGLLILILVAAGAFFTIKYVIKKAPSTTPPAAPTATPKPKAGTLPGYQVVEVQGTGYSALLSLSGSGATPVVSVSII